MALLSNLKREAKFLAKQRYILGLLTTVFLLSVFAVSSGISESQSQLQTIERLKHKDQLDRENVLAKQTSYGSAGYYTFHLTYAAPSSLAFAAMGQRDVIPWKHRIRMLALEGQIYETDADNPELSFLGRFDFAFIISVLLPLFVILLLHDIKANERESGRYDLLITTAKNSNELWRARAIVMCLGLAGALLIPFTLGAIVSQADLISTCLMALVVVAHITFWMLLILWLTNRKFTAKQSATQIASILLSVWLAFTVLLPVGSDLVIDAMVESPNGGEIVLTQREAVNDAWDLPFSATWEEFLKTHPQWANYTEMNSLFEWKWYYAFQQVGDQKAHALSSAYRDAILEKDKLASYFSWVSPPMLTQRLMSSIAATDTQASVQYEQRIRHYHQALRQFYYPLMFKGSAFSLETMSEVPEYSDNIKQLKNEKERS